MKNTKYTQDEVEEIFKKHNLILKDIYKNNKINMFCMDLYNYKYSTSLNKILSGRTPYRVHASNPYVIENIKLYLFENNKTLKILGLEYKNAYSKINWMCECGEIFSSSWGAVQSGKSYCNFCAKSKRWDGYRDYTSEVKSYCKEKGFTLLTEYIHRCGDIFEYICDKHRDKGIKTSTYDQMVSCGRGCMECGIESRGIKHRFDENKFKVLIESKGFIYVGYDYDNINSKYKKVNIHFMCPNHIDKGVQKIKYNNLLNSNGRCKYCAGRERTKEDLQNELNELHGLVTILEYTDYASPLKAKCNICNLEWETKGVNLTQGHRCPNCAKSNFELEIAKILDKWGYSHIDEFWYKNCRNKNPLPFDFYLDDFNILIEADGEHHYKPIRRGSMTDDDAEDRLKQIIFHDEIKTEYCKANNIPLIRIPYWERDHAEYFLFNELSKYKAIQENVVA